MTAKKKWQIADDKLMRILANIISDAMSRLQDEKEMSYQAYYDMLTGLPNKVLFCNRLEQALDLAKRMNQMVGVVYIDLDGFKTINDTLGHDWGDQLLKQVGNRIQNCIRKYDTIARIGGDEFLIQLPQMIWIKDIEIIVTKILEVLRQPMMINEKEFFVSASIGISVFPKDGDGVDQLIQHADLAMYHSKNNGKNQFAFCNEGMIEALAYQREVTNSLHFALEKDELHLVYQPQRDAISGQLVGIEALARWEQPCLGSVSPSVFIPIAEQTGLINPIGEWVLLRACQYNQHWQKQGYKPTRIAVNVSAEQFRSDDILATIKRCLLKSGLEAQYLELDITESMSMSDLPGFVEVLEQIRQLGVTIAIDDFGTEYSSLSKIKELPIDKIKMDMQFVQGIGKNPKDESIISVILHLAKCLNLKVSAEGVETAEQLAFLAQEGCDEVQGYYTGRPLSSDDIETILQKV